MTPLQRLQDVNTTPATPHKRQLCRLSTGISTFKKFSIFGNIPIVKISLSKITSNKNFSYFNIYIQFLLLFNFVSFWNA